MKIEYPPGGRPPGTPKNRGKGEITKIKSEGNSEFFRVSLKFLKKLVLLSEAISNILSFIQKQFLVLIFLKFKSRGGFLMFGIGIPELLVLLLIALVIFGANKLPEIGAGLGKAIKNFKKAASEPDEIDITTKNKNLSSGEKEDTK